mmetsp:Transcript_3712/g.5624  ORF Transcript_3712/g.5624 Transcript_3712/m.5624 type:complete len:98 (-) Transcript_3712:477-770(-)
MDPYGNVFEKYTAKDSRATLVYQYEYINQECVNEDIPGLMDLSYAYTISNIKCKDSDLHSFIHPISLKINRLLKWHPNIKKLSSESCTRNQRTPKNT